MMHNKKFPIIYTRRGDSGNTTLQDGTRVNKSEFILDIIGELDELNVLMGNLRLKIRQKITLNTLTNKIHRFFMSLLHSNDKFDRLTTLKVIEVHIYSLQQLFSHIQLYVSSPCNPDTNRDEKLLNKLNKETISLEGAIDSIGKQIYRNFQHNITPGVNEIENSSNICKVQTRKLERHLNRQNTFEDSSIFNAAYPKSKHIDPRLKKFMNRLSDYFYIVSDFSGKELFDMY